MYSDPHSSAYKDMFEIALRRGESKRKNRYCRFDGTYTEVPTFLGPRPRFTGVFTALYYGTPILTVDFDNKRITDHGKSGFSPSTGTNIAGWIRVLRTYTHDLPVFDVLWSFQYWLRDIGYPAHIKFKELRARFLAPLSWVKQDWFHWKAYDASAVVCFINQLAILMDDQNWRYLTCDWDAEGAWSRRFIDAAAERRWNARERSRKASR